MTAVPITLTSRRRTAGRTIAVRTPRPDDPRSRRRRRGRGHRQHRPLQRRQPVPLTPPHDTRCPGRPPRRPGHRRGERMSGVPTTRITYHDLPQRVRTAIEEVTGPVASAVSASEGFNSAVAARLSTPDWRPVLQGACPPTIRWVWTQQREAADRPVPERCGTRARRPARSRRLGRPAVRGDSTAITPTTVPARPTCRPWSRYSSAIAAIPCPPVELRDAGQRLRNYVNDPADVHHFAGSTLLHTDLNPANVIVNADRARIVDWGWATRGAVWLDPAYWVLWLIAAGHDPAAAEQWASKVAGWHTATREGLNAFVLAQAVLWTEVAGAIPTTHGPSD